jgi:hypothetical protein
MIMAKGIAHFGILFSLIIYSGHANAILVSDLLISEVMANPSALPDAHGEWFELYNPTDHEINLRDIWIGDDDRDLHKIETDLLILPTEYLTLARSVDPGFTPDYVYDNFTLGNGADEIVFSDGLMELLRLDYGAGFVEAGQSRELLGLPQLAPNFGLTFASIGYDLGDIGTPGEAGSVSFDVSPVPLPAAAWLFVSGILAVLSPTILRRKGLQSQQTASSSRYVGPPRKRGSRSASPIPCLMIQQS